MKLPDSPPENYSVDPKIIVECINDSIVSQFLNGVNSEYLPWEKFRYKKMPPGYEAETLWAVAKILRGINPIRFEFCEKSTILFSYNLTDKIHAKLHEFDMNIGGSMSSKGIIPDQEKDRYLISSIMEEAIASSQLEGAVTTRKVAKEMLRKERPPQNKSEQMILNNYVTIQKILEWRGRKITKESILELHRLVTRETLENPEDAGRFRKSDNINVVDGETGEIIHVPPKCENLDDLMESFLRFANDESPDAFIHPIIKASILHFLIGYIHPFVDGNGRTARTIFYWVLIKKGYWLLEYMSISRMIKKAPKQYAKAYIYSEQDGNDLTYFINYKLKTMDLAFRSLKDYINRKIKEKRQFYSIATIDKLNERQVNILKMFIEEPTQRLTFKEVQNTFGIVYQTARTDLLSLLELGLLNKKTEGKKKQVFYRSKGFQKRLESLMDAES